MNENQTVDTYHNDFMKNIKYNDEIKIPELLKVKDDKSDNQIKFVFDQQSLDLKKWEIYDEFGNKTVFKFTKIKKNIFISQNLFVVKYN